MPFECRPLRPPYAAKTYDAKSTLQTTFMIGLCGEIVFSEALARETKSQGTTKLPAGIPQKMQEVSGRTVPLGAPPRRLASPGRTSAQSPPKLPMDIWKLIHTFSADRDVDEVTLRSVTREWRDAVPVPSSKCAAACPRQQGYGMGFCFRWPYESPPEGAKFLDAGCAIVVETWWCISSLLLLLGTHAEAKKVVRSVLRRLPTAIYNIPWYHLEDVERSDREKKLILANQRAGEGIMPSNDLILRAALFHPHRFLGESFTSLARYGRRHFVDNKQFMLAATTTDGLLLRWASTRLQSDPDVVLAAVSQDGWALQYAPSCQGDRGIVLAAVSRTGSALQYAPSFQGDRAIVLAAVSRNGSALQYAPSLQGDRAIALAAVSRDGMALRHAPSFQGDRAIVKAAVKENGAALNLAAPMLQSDKEVLDVITSNAVRFRDAYEVLRTMPQLRGHRAMVEAAINQTPGDDVLQYASPELQANREVVMAAVKSKVSELKYASEKLRGDKNFMLDVLRRSHGEALQYASEALRGDVDVVEAALLSDRRCSESSSLRYAAPSLQANKELVTAAVRRNTRAFRHAAPELRRDRLFVGSLIRRASPDVLRGALDGLRADRELVLQAVRRGGRALEYAAEDLRADEEVVREAVRQDGTALKYASKDLKAAKEVVLEAVRQDGRALEYAAEPLRADKDVVMTAFSSCFYGAHYVLDFVSKDLFQDWDVALGAARAFGLRGLRAQKGNEDKTLALAALRAEAAFAKPRAVLADLECVSASLFADPDVVFAAAARFGASALRYASRDLLKDERFVANLESMLSLRKRQTRAPGPWETAFRAIRSAAAFD